MKTLKNIFILTMTICFLNSCAIVQASERERTTTIPGIPLTKDKVVAIPSISSIVGDGKAIFSKGDQVEILQARVNGTIPVVNGKSCFFCVKTIKIGPNTKVPMAPYFKESPQKGQNMSVLNFGLDGPIPENATDFIISGPNGATLQKDGNGFFLVKGVAHFVQITSSSTGSAQGVLVDVRTKSPLHDLDVRLFRVDKVEASKIYFSGKAAASSKTDRNGKFVFDNVQIGKYILVLATSTGRILKNATPGSYKIGSKTDIIEIVPSQVADLGTRLVD